MNPHLLVITLYAAVLVSLGIFVSRHVRGASEFFVAGRRLPPGLLFATMLAANIGGGSTVGAAGLGYRDGLSAWWWVGSAGMGQLLLAYTVGPRIWRLAASGGFYTLGDYLEQRYSRSVRGVIAVLLWLGSLTILAGQIIGIAWILNVVTGVSKPAGCLIGGLCVTIYFTAGGLLSAAWVNVLQLLVKMAGFTLALPLVMIAAGGWDGIASAGISRHSESYVSLAGIGAGGIASYLVLLVPPFVVSPGLLQKIYGARDEFTVRRATAANGLVLLLFSFAPVILGMAANSAFPELSHRELALPTVMTHMLPVWVGSLALAAIFSAEVSSADAVLFMLSTSLSKDLYKGFLRPDATDNDLFRVSRISSLVAGILGIALAILLPSIITALTIFYGLIAVSLFVPVVAGLYFRYPSAQTALLSIGLSVPITAFVHLMTGGEGIHGFSPVAFGLLVSSGILLLDAMKRGARRRSEGF